MQLFITGFTRFFFLSEDALMMPWQFLTAVFLHGSLAHLFYNLFALFLFGFILEKSIGSKRFFWLFIVSGILANLISWFWFPNALGASGAIMAVIGCLAVLRPAMTVWAFNLPMPMFVAALLWIAGNVLGLFGIGDPTTGYLAHLSGIVVGIVYGFYLRIHFKRIKDGYSVYKSRIVINEEAMRRWEDRNLR